MRDILIYWLVDVHTKFELSPEAIYLTINIVDRFLAISLMSRELQLVSKSGYVKVDKLMNVERYSHVMHISSTVTGELQDHLTCWDALHVAFPIGTVNGAPKVSPTVTVMRLTNELDSLPYAVKYGRSPSDNKLSAQLWIGVA
ncbi:hypothetical protein RYX36_033678 [Vicia faba]